MLPYRMRCTGRAGKKIKNCPPMMMRQAAGFQGKTVAFLFGFKGTSIIFACRVKKTGQNF
jgi:hypothetical protein